MMHANALVIDPAGSPPLLALAGSGAICSAAGRRDPSFGGKPAKCSTCKGFPLTSKILTR